MRPHLILISIFLLIAGCGISVIPVATERNVVDFSTKTSKSSNDGVTVTARILDLEVSPYIFTNNITSFFVSINNQKSDSLTIPLESFILVDNVGNQFRALQPSQVVALAKASSDYLVPYPYVGYYYLGDKEQGSFENVSGLSSNNSSMSFPKQPYPAQILLESLPVDSILPRGQVSGSVYFAVDLYDKESVELRIYPPDSPPPAPAKFVFPFSISR